jgi:hypothetical protein
MNMPRARSVGLIGCLLSVAAIACPPAKARPSPSVYTGEAAEVTLSSGTLKGSVNPAGQPTSYYFEFGQSTVYGAQTPTTAAGTGYSAVHVAVPIAGLAVASTYHYRLVATNPSGTVLGTDHTFTTKRIPLTFTLAAVPRLATFASPFTVTGIVSGTGAPGLPLVLQANAFPYTNGFKPITAPVLANPTGAFAFSLRGLAVNAELRVSTLNPPQAFSRILLQRVAVRVRLHVRHGDRPGLARLYGTVVPGQAAAVVRLQWINPRGHAVNMASEVITGRPDASDSRFSRLLRVRRRGLYRAYVVVAGAQVPGHSPPVRIG